MTSDIDLELDRAIVAAIGDIVATAPDGDDDLPLTLEPLTGRRPQRVLLTAAASAVIVAGLAALALATRPSDPAPAGPAAAPVDDTTVYRAPTTADELVLDLFPIIADEWAGTASVSANWGYALPDDSTSPIMDTLVARVEGSAFGDAIRIAVGTMDTSDWGTATSTTVAGIDVEVYSTDPRTRPATSVVVLPGEPQVTVTGQDPIAYLEAVGGSPVSGLQTDAGGEVGFAITQPPVGYEIVFEPTLRPFGATNAQIAIGGDGTGDDAAATTSVENPLLTYALFGDVEQIDVNGTQGWMLELETMVNLYWQVGDVWVSAEGATTVEDALELAGSIVLVDETTWSERYDVDRPLLPTEQPD